MKGDNIVVLLDEYVTLQEEISEIKTSINRLKWFAIIFMAIGIFISGVIVNSIKETSVMQHQMLGQKIIKVQNAE